MTSEAQKQQIYQNWIQKGRPWFNIDPKKDPTYAERQIILEILKRENARLNQRKVNEVKRLDRLMKGEYY